MQRTSMHRRMAWRCGCSPIPLLLLSLVSGLLLLSQFHLPPLSLPAPVSVHAATPLLEPPLPYNLVYLRFHLLAISEIDGVDQTFSTDFWMLTTYAAPYPSALGGNYNISASEAAEMLWDPRLEFINSRGEILSLTSEPYTLAAEPPFDVTRFGQSMTLPSGWVWVMKDQRFQLDFSTVMNMNAFPFDIQHLQMLIESNWPADRVRLLFATPEDADAAKLTVHMSPTIGWTFETAYQSDYNVSYAYNQQTFPRLEVTTTWKRQPEYYMSKIVAGTMLLVLMCVWNFSLQVDASDRMMGTLQVFTGLITFLFVASSDTPKVPYQTRLDVFMMFSFLIVALIMFLHGVLYYFREQGFQGEKEERMIELERRKMARYLRKRRERKLVHLLSGSPGLANAPRKLKRQSPKLDLNVLATTNDDTVSMINPKSVDTVTDKTLASVFMPPRPAPSTKVADSPNGDGHGSGNSDGTGDTSAGVASSAPGVAIELAMTNPPREAGGSTPISPSGGDNGELNADGGQNKQQTKQQPQQPQPPTKQPPSPSSTSSDQSPPPPPPPPPMSRPNPSVQRVSDEEDVVIVQDMDVLPGSTGADGESEASMGAMAGTGPVPLTPSPPPSVATTTTAATAAATKPSSQATPSPQAAAVAPSPAPPRPPAQTGAAAASSSAVTADDESKILVVSIPGSGRQHLRTESPYDSQKPMGHEHEHEMASPSPTSDSGRASNSKSSRKRRAGRPRVSPDRVGAGNSHHTDIESTDMDNDDGTDIDQVIQKRSKATKHKRTGTSTSSYSDLDSSSSDDDEAPFWELRLNDWKEWTCVSWFAALACTRKWDVILVPTLFIFYTVGSAAILGREHSDGSK